MKQNNLKDNLDHWKYINRYSDWMYRQFEKYIGKKIIEVGAGDGRNVVYYIEGREKILATDIFDNLIQSMNDRFGKYQYFQAKKWIY